MIDQTLVFLRDQLNQRLKSDPGIVIGDAGADKDVVVFIDGEKLEPLSFPASAVSLLLVNVEQERQMRRAEPYRRVSAAGAPQRVNPDIRLELSVLFVARFKQYEVSLKCLSRIVEFFQEQPVFRGGEHAELPAAIERLKLEQVSLPFAQQNEVWNALRATYHPSLLYRARTVVFRDRVPAGAPEVTEIAIAAAHKH